MAICKPVSEQSESYKNTMIDKVNSRHRALMRLLISGMRLEEAAEALQFSYQHAVLITNSPLFKAEKEKMRKDAYGDVVEEIKSKAKKEAPASFDTFVNLRDRGVSESEQRKCAENILKIADVDTEKVHVGVAIDAGQGFIDALGRAISEMKEKDNANDK